VRQKRLDGALMRPSDGQPNWKLNFVAIGSGSASFFLPKPE